MKNQNYHVSRGAHSSDKPVRGVQIGLGTEPMKMNKFNRASRFHHRDAQNISNHFQADYSGMNK